MEKESILLVEDDEKLGRQVLGHLEQAGLRVDWRRDGTSALIADPDRYALVVLDLMLPGTYGLDVLRSLRERSDVPVLVLSAKSETTVKVRALELGADDYLTKPFWPEELMARVKARLRRPIARREGKIELGALTLDPDGRCAFADGRPLGLTRAEFDFLMALARKPGAAVERGWLADAVLDPEREGTERTLDVHVSRLRKKLGEHAGYVRTVWGVGYRLEVPER